MPNEAVGMLSCHGKPAQRAIKDPATAPDLRTHGRALAVTEQHWHQSRPIGQWAVKLQDTCSLEGEL